MPFSRGPGWPSGKAVDWADQTDEIGSISQRFGSSFSPKVCDLPTFTYVKLLCDLRTFTYVKLLFDLQSIIYVKLLWVLQTLCKITL